MNKSFNSKVSTRLQTVDVLRASFSFFIFFGVLLFIDTVWTFVINGVTFYFNVFVFSSFIGSLLRVALALPFLLFLAVGTFSGLSKLLQVISSLLVAWIIAYALDFFWSNMIQARLWGLDLVVNGELIRIGLLVGLIIASRDVFFAVCLRISCFGERRNDTG